MYNSLKYSKKNPHKCGFFKINIISKKNPHKCGFLISIFID